MLCRPNCFLKLLDRRRGRTRPKHPIHVDQPISATSTFLFQGCKKYRPLTRRTWAELLSNGKSFVSLAILPLPRGALPAKDMSEGNTI